MPPEIGSLPPAMPPRQFTFVVLLCGFLALSMNVVALVSPSWVTSKHFSLSLWEICSQQTNAWHCRSALSTDWQVASLILVLCATLISGLWFIVSVLWICQVKQPLKFRNLSFLIIISVLLQISALLLFSLLLAAPLLPRSSQFSWGYGLGWGSCIFMLGTVVISCLRNGLAMD